uniref:TOG domain-containing protein n=2 Tax=Meloidogyne incognita group TaxID=654580 RepID=A0A915M7Y5_MELJA
MDPFDLLEPVDIIPKLPADLDTNLASKKWQDRKAVLDLVYEILLKNPKLADNPDCGDLIDKLTKVLKSDANINCAAVAAKCLTGMAKGLRNKFGPHTASLSPIIFDKFKEKKPHLRDPLIELIDAVFATTNLNNLSSSILEAAKKPNPSQKSQLDHFIYRTFRSLNSKDIPKGLLKDLIASLTNHASDSDPEVRDASCAALGAIQKCIGESALAVFLGAEIVKDSTKMSKIAEYREKAVVEAESLKEASENNCASAASSQQSQQQISTNTNNQQQSVPEPQPQQIDPFELLEPVDIIPKLPGDLDTQLASKKWQERKAVLDSVHGILLENPKLADNPDYGDLIDKLTKVLKADANINCAAVAAKCLTGMAKGLRNKFGPHTASLSPIIFDKFKEKKPHLRDPLIELIDAVFATTNLNNLSASILEAAKKPNPSQKSQLDHFIYRTFRSLNSKDIPKGLLKDLIASLTNHASDSDPEVRDASCAALGAIQKCIGESALAVFLGAEIISEYREKAVSECPNAKIESVKSVVAPPPPPNVKKVDENKSKVQNNSAKPTTTAANNKPESVPDSVENSEDDASTQVQQPNQKKAVKNSKQQQKPEQPKVEPKVEVSEPEFLLLFKSDRALRLKEEKALKTLKWNFDTPTAEHLEQLTNSLTAVTKPPLTGQLFNKDFKQHIKAIEYLNEVHAASPECIINNIDLLLKWSTLRFFDTNPTVLIKVLEFILAVFTQMEAMNEGLNDLEMQSFLPYLLLKCGDSKDLIRNQVRKIVHVLNSISVPAKIFPLILDSLKTKNSRQKTEGLVIAESLIEILGLSITTTPQITMRTFGACIAERDAAVRNAALNAIITVYRGMSCDRDKIFSLIGQLGEKERAMLDERIKRTGAFDPKSANRPQTTRDMSTSRLNSRMQNSSSQPNSTIRARSASGPRRPLDLALPGNNSMMVAGADDNNNNNVRAPRRSHNVTATGLSSAHSHAALSSALNQTGGRFQLDPKFFQNDFDDGGRTLVVNSGGANQSTSLNSTFTKNDVGQPERGVLANRNVQPSGSSIDQQDLQPIKPVIRPVSTFSRRSESVSSISSLESTEYIDRAVHNVSCLQLSIADEAIAQLLHLLNDPNNRQYIIDRSELILKMIVTQVFHIRSQHLEQLESGKEVNRDEQNFSKENELNEFLRSICNFLSTLTNETHIMKRISADTLRGFIEAILSLVCDQRLSGFKDQVFRSLNVVVIRLCEFTHPSVCFLALMKLIMKYQAAEPKGKMMDLLRKCMIKRTETLTDPAIVDMIDIPTLLEHINTYITRFYITTNEGHDSDASVKETSKLLFICVQRIVVKKKYSILNYLDHLPENSHIVLYVKRCVRAVGKRNTTGDEKTPDGTPPFMEEMEKLFARIDDDIFSGAVEDLYNFMDIHPEQNANLEQFMSKCIYASLIRKAFVEIRKCRLERKPLIPGDSVRRILPEETLSYLDKNNQIIACIDEFTALLSGSPAATLGQPHQKSTPPS